LNFDWVQYGEKVNLGSNEILPYSPSNVSMYDKSFREIQIIYSSSLAATQILLVEDLEGHKYAAKKIYKNKLRSSYMHEFLKNEIAIQFSLSRLSENIVKVPEYFEDEERYIMLMEYSSFTDYFDDMLENVKFFINLEVYTYFR
jgi:hypothetical protein